MKYNSWTIVDDTSYKKTIVRCDCGIEAIRSKGDIVNGKSKSCNTCRYKKRKGGGNPWCEKHGKSNSREMQSWSDMKRRCYSKNRKDYKNYGGRGISVCDRWLNGDGVVSGFHCFLIDMGVRPDGMTLDRINSSGNYEPLNCRWANTIDQMNNRRDTIYVEVNNEKISLANASRILGLEYQMAYRLLKNKGSI